MNRFRRRYAASPLHLLLMLGSFALALYAGVRLLDGDAVGVLVWFAGAAVVHDLVLLPLYASAGRALARAAGGGRWVNHVRVPAFVSGLLALVWFPLVFMPPRDYTAVTGLPSGVFLERWLLITVALFALSALTAATRTLYTRRRVRR